jgi:hypothetical protein
MKCTIDHSSPYEHATPEHINECYRAYEIYWDRDGLVTEEEFENRTEAERTADLAALRRNA